MVAIEIERTSIRSFHFELHDQRSGAHRFFDLDELDGTGKWSEPLKLTLRGSVAGSFPYAVAIAGGSARLLQEGHQAWPFILDLEFLGARLHADGTVDINAGSARFAFRAGTEDFEQMGRFLQTTLPSLGPAALSGSVMASLSAVELKDLRGKFGPSELSGGLVLTMGGARQRVSGELAITTLDARPFLDSAPQPPERRLTYDELMRQRLPVHNLMRMDADVVLRVDRWLGLAFDVRDAQIAVHDGRERHARTDLRDDRRGPAYWTHRLRDRWVDSDPGVGSNGEKRAAARPPAIIPERKQSGRHPRHGSAAGRRPRARRWAPLWMTWSCA